MSLMVGGIALALLILGKIFLKHKPVALFVVIGGIIAASALFTWRAHGVKFIGAVPQGLPPFRLPAVYWQDLNQLLPLAFACFTLGAVETATIRGECSSPSTVEDSMPIKKIWRLQRRTWLAGLGSGFPVSGGKSQSLVNEDAGARTPLSTALAGVFILVVVLFFSHLLERLAATGPRRSSVSGGGGLA